MAEPTPPDLIQAVLGFRAWAVDDDGWLLPFSLGTVAGPWRPGNNDAVCHYAKWRRDGARDVHDAPHPRCMCGLYALTDRDDPRLAAVHGVVAVGAIAAWGDLEVHRSGFRAQHAKVLALGLFPGTPRTHRERLEGSARRYGVELVPAALLEATGLRYAAPVPPELLPGADPDARVVDPAARGRRRRRAARRDATSAGAPPARGRGLRVEDHVWLEASTLRTGITRAFADRLGAGAVDLALPSPGSLHRTSDALARLTGGAGETLVAWTPLAGVVTEVNPALADDPGLLLRDPEGDGWIAALRPTAWAQDAAGLEWGPAGTLAYAATLAEPDPWDGLRETALRVRTGEDVLAELRRRRAAPRYADADAVHAQLVAPFAAALAAAPERARRAGRAGVRVGFVLSDPATRFVLDARPPAARVVADDPRDPVDLELSMSAEAAERFLAGRLDVARALRAGEVTSSAPAARTLAVASILTALPAVASGAGRRPPMRS